jgi:hypothetical protein
VTFRAGCPVAAILGGVLACSVARADGSGRDLASGSSSGVTTDRAVVRFFSPETGGAAYPRFVLERVLALEARLEAMGANAQGIGDGYDESDVRAALERHIAEELLASLADRLIADSPPARRPTPSELASVERDVTAAWVERLGGRGRVDDAARAEQLSPSEVDDVLRRSALAAWYIDRAVLPILHPSDEQLRDLYRTALHPYRDRPFDQVRSALERWFVVERARVAEGAFLQSARSRLKVIVTK